MEEKKEPTKYVVLTSNDSTECRTENPELGCRLYSDEDGKDPVTKASEEIWSRMQADLSKDNIVKVELNGDVVFCDENNECEWGAVGTMSDVRALQKLKHDEVVKTYGLLSSAAVLVSDDGLYCGVFHRTHHRIPNDDTAEW